MVWLPHAGHGTVIKSLAAGVPMVLMPQGRDQADTAVRVTARGAGIVLQRTAGTEAIAASIRRLLQNHSYRISAQQLGGAIRRDAQSDALVRELEDIPNDNERETDGSEDVRADDSPHSYMHFSI